MIVNQKYLAHLSRRARAVLLAPLVAGTGWVEHHLLLYGTDPGWTYSDMNGFGPFVRPFVWFKLYWARVGRIAARRRDAALGARP